MVPVSTDHLDVGHPGAAAAVELLDELGVGVAGEGIEFVILILFPVLSLRPLLVLPGCIDSGERQVEDQRGCQDGEDCFVRRHHALMLMLIVEVVEVQVAWESAALWVNPGLIRPILTGDPEK